MPSAAISPPTSVPNSLEGAGVEEVVDAGAGVEFALAVMLGQPLVAAHLARVLAPAAQVVRASPASPALCSSSAS